ncbi:hypothetical protein FACS189465_1420 [Clostridia bacterium]|nr:hypothetical protein FACS189465_1420 [Clostridia bacterium]
MWLKQQGENFGVSDENKFHNIVHDLKTPLVSILGYIELLKFTKYDKKSVFEYYDIIQSEAQRLLNLIDDINHNEKSQKCCINDLICGIIKSFSPIVDEKNIKIDFLYEKNFYVTAPTNHLYRIFANIIENAVKYNKENGSISIKISSVSGMVVTKIENTGIGICQDDIEKVFMPLYRAKNAMASLASGSGRGLTVVQNIVKSLFGTVDVRSELGKETEFTIRLPSSD